MLLFRCLGCLLIAFVGTWRFFFLLLGLMVTVVVTYGCFRLKFDHSYIDEELNEYKNVYNLAREILCSIRTVLAFGLQNKMINSFESIISIAQKITLKKELLNEISTGLFNALFTIFFATALYYGAYLAKVDCDNFSPRTILQVLFGMIIATLSYDYLKTLLRKISETKEAATSIFHIIDRKSRPSIIQASKIQIEQLKGDIEFENVHFNNPQRKDDKILQGINLNIPSGKTVALFGARYIKIAFIF